MTAPAAETQDIATLRSAVAAATTRLANISNRLTEARTSISPNHGDPLGRSIAAAIAAGDDTAVARLRAERANAERDCAELPRAVAIATKARSDADAALARVEIMELRPALVASRANLEDAVTSLRNAVREYVRARQTYSSVFSRCDFANVADKANPHRAENVAPLSGLVLELFVKLRDL